jgi:hypothetical protein
MQYCIRGLFVYIQDIKSNTTNTNVFFGLTLSKIILMLKNACHDECLSYSIRIHILILHNMPILLLNWRDVYIGEVQRFTTAAIKGPLTNQMRLIYQLTNQTRLIYQLTNQTRLIYQLTNQMRTKYHQWKSKSEPL